MTKKKVTATDEDFPLPPAWWAPDHFPAGWAKSDYIQLNQGNGQGNSELRILFVTSRFNMRRVILGD